MWGGAECGAGQGGVSVAALTADTAQIYLEQRESLENKYEVELCRLGPTVYLLLCSSCYSSVTPFLLVT